MTEQVNHPAHYATPDKESQPILEALGLYANKECIEVIDEFNLNFNMGSAIKYLWRLNSKGNRYQNLQKAQWYFLHELWQRQQKDDIDINIPLNEAIMEAMGLIDELLAQYEPNPKVEMTTRI